MLTNVGHTKSKDKGAWSQEQKTLHINVREVMAAEKGLHKLLNRIHNAHILLQMDKLWPISIRWGAQSQNNAEQWPRKFGFGPWNMPPG